MLCEQGDLAGATSSASSKLIHGGLRYLEYYQFRFVREALLEREVLLGIAPHIVWPARFILPHDKGLRPAFVIEAGLFLYDWLAAAQPLGPLAPPRSPHGQGGRPAQGPSDDRLCLFGLPRGRCQTCCAERCRRAGTRRFYSHQNALRFGCAGARHVAGDAPRSARGGDNDRDGTRARQCGGTLGRRGAERALSAAMPAKNSVSSRAATSSCPAFTRESNAMSCKTRIAASSS